MAKLIVLVGLPGSGKSTYAEQLVTFGNTFSDEDEVVTYHSSDAIRKELFGDAQSQENNALVFETLHKRVREDLKAGHTVIYDATNVTRKARRGALNLLGKGDIAECHIVWAPIQTCVKRDQDRPRNVGWRVIDKFIRRWQSPWYDEGFETLVFINTDDSFDQVKYIRAHTLNMCIPHDNPHHTLGVMEHCEQAYNNLQNCHIMPHVVETATLWHDVGKPYTKGYKNKPDSDIIDYSVAHYYDHQCVGAYLAYGLYCSDYGTLPSQESTDELCMFSWLICNHMEPFFNSKYYKNLPPRLKEYIDAMHEADLSAH